MSKLIFGCGYLGHRVALRWRSEGQQVFVVTRSEQHAKGFAAEGLTPIVADVTRKPSLGELPRAETVLYAIGFDRAAGRTMRETYVDGLRAALETLPADTGNLIYVSTTGVYGQSDGEWVDEDSPCEPAREGGRLCLEAEQLLDQRPLGARAIVLRMAGIYGPERVPNAAAIRAGSPLEAPDQGWLNLIHVDDAAAVVLAAERGARPPRTYVVSDGVPVLRRDYYAELARLLNAPSPRFVAPSPTSPAAARAGDGLGKRIDSHRMRTELPITLRYPTYREGLAAIVADAAS